MKSLRRYIAELLQKNSDRILTSRYLNRWAVMSLDLATVALALFLSHFLYFHLVPFSGSFPSLAIYMPVSLVVAFGVFSYMGMHTGIIRYAGYHEVYRVISVNIVLHLSLWAISTLLSPDSWLICTYIIATSFFLNLLGMLSSRLVLISSYQLLIHYAGFSKQRSLIWGMDSRRAGLADGISKDPASPFIIVGFITRDKELASKRVGQFNMLFLTDQNAAHLLRKHRINTVIFTKKDDLLREKESFLKVCVELKVSIYITPAMESDALNYSFRKQIRKLRIEDLLGREEINIDTERISKKLSGKVVLVTGAAGSIGKELVLQVAQFNPAQLILLDIAETPLHSLQLELEEKFPHLNFVSFIGDVRDVNRIKYLFSSYHPECIYHAAAYKHVPMMESNPCEAVMVNVQGTRNVLNCALRNGSKYFVMISTDKAVNPSNVMGASKRIAEIYVQAMAKYLNARGYGDKIRCVTTRFGNVLGSNGSVIPHFKEQIEKGGPITVTHPEIIRYFMTIPEACRLVLEAGSFGKSGEIYVFDMGEPVRIKDLAERMIELSGLEPGKDIMIKYTGLRPGEKLYEELLNDGEHTKPTSHPKIMIADVREYDLREVGKRLRQLISLASGVDIQGTVISMKEIAPEFISINSEFEALDKPQE